MKITIKENALAEMIKAKEINLSDYFQYWQRDQVEKKIKNDNELSEYLAIDISDFDKAKTKKFLALITKYDVAAKTITSVNLWLNNLNNPASAVITSLANFKKLFENVIAKSSLKWIWRQNPDGMLVPYLVEEVKYRAASRDESAYVSISLSSMRIKNDRWDDTELKIQKESSYVYINKEDIIDAEEELPSFNYEEEYDDEDDDDEKKTKKKRTKGGYELTQILSNNNLFLTTESIYANYNKEIEKYNRIKNSIGKVYVTEGKCYTIFDNKGGYSGWKFANVDEKISKLVVDNLNDKEAISSPLHPYILTYNLTNYCYCCVHVEMLKEYVYDETIVDKLIIGSKKKDLLKAIISNENNFSDIVAGKSGGIVILASGKAGLGKTLTAEAYSEVMKKPLYCIQSSQLGISVDDIEKRLNKILYRAEKWGAVLLIDEADTYISQRGDNIVQNCIVGIFLRLLEYFNGVLFLTTNRFDIIDDAIMSRVTAHIKYEYPNQEETLLIWKVLTKNFGLKIQESSIAEIYHKYETFSGRDIRNFLKMYIKTSSKKEITYQSVKELRDFLPFIRNRDI
jgi:hypothetical protein